MSKSRSFRVPDGMPHIDFVLDNLPIPIAEYIVKLIEKDQAIKDNGFQGKMVEYHSQKMEEWKNLENYKIALDQRHKCETEKAKTNKIILEYMQSYHTKLHDNNVGVTKKDAEHWLKDRFPTIKKESKLEITIDDFKSIYNSEFENVAEA